MVNLFGFLRKKTSGRAHRPAASPRGEQAGLAPHQKTGRAGERAAERFLKRRGYRILARNVSYRQGEVDLVALDKRSGALCFVEVRSRAGADPLVSPEESVTLRKRRRIVSAARKFIADRSRGAGSDCPARFDIVAVRFADSDRKHPEISHYPAAFDATGVLT